MTGRKGATRVLVTRAAEQAGEVCHRLAAAGFEPVCLPLIALGPLPETAALDAALHRLEDYRWIVFGSANAVRFFCERAVALGKGQALGRHQGIVAGPASAATLSRYGLRAALTPAPFSAERAGQAMAPAIEPGCRVLLPRAEGGREALADGLRSLGAAVDEVVLYRTQGVVEGGAAAVEGLAKGRFGAVAFFSPSAVRSLAAAASSSLPDVPPPYLLDGVVVACIGPTTAQAVEQVGWYVDVVAPNTTAGALVDALVDALVALSRTPPNQPHNIRHKPLSLDALRRIAE